MKCHGWGSFLQKISCGMQKPKDFYGTPRKTKLCDIFRGALRSVIEFIHNLDNSVTGDGSEVQMFLEVLSNKSVGVLVQLLHAPKHKFCGIRMRKIDLGFKLTIF